METIDYQDFLKIPDIKITGDLDKYKNFKELKSSQKDELELSSGILQEKELSLFGYRFFDIKKLTNISYEKDSKKEIKNLLEYNFILSQKIKHKSESSYITLLQYQNFYPTQLSFNNEKKSGKIKLKTSNSSYQTKFWTEDSFPNLQPIFKSYFKDGLKEKANKL